MRDDPVMFILTVICALVAVVAIVVALLLVRHHPVCPDGYYWHVYMIKPLIARCDPLPLPDRYRPRKKGKAAEMSHELTFTYVLTVKCRKRSGPDKSTDRLHREILAAFEEVDGERMRIDDDTDQGATYETSWVPEIASITDGHGDVWEPFRKPVT